MLVQLQLVWYGFITQHFVINQLSPPIIISESHLQRRFVHGFVKLNLSVTVDHDTSLFTQHLATKESGGLVRVAVGGGATK